MVLQTSTAILSSSFSSMIFSRTFLSRSSRSRLKEIREEVAKAVEKRERTKVTRKRKKIRENLKITADIIFILNQKGLLASLPLCPSWGRGHDPADEESHELSGGLALFRGMSFSGHIDQRLWALR